MSVPAGRPYRPRPEVAARLTAWRDGCQQGLTVRQIADGLRISPATLMRSIYRARDHDHPDAVPHPLAGTYAKSLGLVHTVRPQQRAIRVRRLAREADARDDKA